MFASSINRFERIDLWLREPAELEGKLRFEGVAVVCDQFSVSPSITLTRSVDKSWREVVEFGGICKVYQHRARAEFQYLHV